MRPSDAAVSRRLVWVAILLVATSALSAFFFTRPEHYSDEFLYNCMCFSRPPPGYQITYDWEARWKFFDKCVEALHAEGMSFYPADPTRGCPPFEEWVQVYGEGSLFRETR